MKISCSLSLLLLIATLFGSCQNAPNQEVVLPETVTGLRTQQPGLVYYQPIAQSWTTGPIAADTEVIILEGRPELFYPGRHLSMTLVQPVLAPDTCWIPLNRADNLYPSPLLDSLRKEQTVRAILKGDAEMERYHAYCEAWAGEVERPFHFLLTEGDRLANFLTRGDQIEGELLRTMELLAGPLLPGYRLIVREDQPLLVRHWPSWEELAGKETDEKWPASLIDHMRSCYQQDSLADPLSLRWWVYTDTRQRHHRLGDSSTLVKLGELAAVVAQEAGTFASVLELSDQAIRPLAADDISFWYDLPALLWELDSILATDWSIIAERERIALGVLRDRLNAPDTSGIRVNFRSGRFD